jgi:hypothetical protein
MQQKLGLLLPLLMASALLLAACGSDSKSTPDLATYGSFVDCQSNVAGRAFLGTQRGNNMSVTVYGVAIKDAVYYSVAEKEGATYYKLTPSNPENKLALVQVSVRNDKSTTLVMNVDDKSYRLLDKEGTEFPSVDPFKNRQLSPNVPNNEPYAIFVWGPFDIQKEFGVTACALFEVPASVKPTQFRWDAVETVFVRFEN